MTLRWKRCDSRETRDVPATCGRRGLGFTGSLSMVIQVQLVFKKNFVLFRARWYSVESSYKKKIKTFLVVCITFENLISQFENGTACIIKN